jgi:serine protease
MALAGLLGLAGGAGAETAIGPARDFAPRQLVVKFEGEPRGRAVVLPNRLGVREAVAALRRNPGVAYAHPNYIATASVLPNGLPNDPGPLGGAAVPGGWTLKQWNFLPWEATGTASAPTSPGGIDVVGAWRNLVAAGRAGGRGVTVAVLDTGVAYRSLPPRFLRSPDFDGRQFTRGFDFVDRDPIPLDLNGHGTHIAGTIAEKTGNGVGLTGVAYRANVMPIRVLDRLGRGTADDIADGIRFATAAGADVINMSFNFACGRPIPTVDEALRKAHSRGVVTVASIGNLGAEACVSPPATGPHTIGVGGTTEGGCLGNYSLTGEGVDLLAPGGGTPVPGCPSVSMRPIYQVTFKGHNPRRFGVPGSYIGTSMAAAHVSGVAALAIASGVLGPDPSPGKVEARLAATARSLALAETRQGAGLIDAAAATDPAP